MKINSWPKKFRKKRSARNGRIDICKAFSSLSLGINGNSNIFAVTKSPVRNYGGSNIAKYHLQAIANLHVHENAKKVLVSQERNLLNPSLPVLCFPRGPRSKRKVARKERVVPVLCFPRGPRSKRKVVRQERVAPVLCFPRGPRSKRKVARKERVVFSHMAGEVSAEGISKECLGSACSTTLTRASQMGHKRKTKPKDESSDSEVIVPRRTHFRGQARRVRNSCNISITERGKLDSATFLHYFTHIWGAFPEDKVKSFTCFDPLYFNLYADEKNRAMVLNWIKGTAAFSKKYVLVPIVLWSHWSLLIFCHLGESLDSKNSTPCMLLLDSLHAIGPTRLEPLIRRLLLDMYKMEGRMETKEQLKKVPLLIPKVPQQKRGEECGYLVLYYINLFVENAPENFSISEGYPYFMKKDWFTVEGLQSFYKRLDSFPVVWSEHDDSISMDSGDSDGTTSLLDVTKKLGSRMISD